MEDFLARITVDPNICHGKPCVRGLRYPVEVMLDVLGSCMTWAEILEDFDDLEADDLRAVLAYSAVSVPLPPPGIHASRVAASTNPSGQPSHESRI